MSRLREATRTLLINRPRTLTYLEICNATKLPMDFIRRLASNRSQNEGVEQIEKLYNYLGGKPLKL